MGNDTYMLQETPESTSWRMRVAHFFRERQVYLRSDGQVNFITIRPWVQVCALMFILIASFWVVFATVNVAFKDQIIAAKKLKYHRMQSAYEDQLAAMASSITQLNGRLLLNQDAYEAKLGVFRTQQNTLRNRQERIEALMGSGFNLNKLQESSKTVLSSLPSLKAMKTGADGDHLELVFERRAPVVPQSRENLMRESLKKQKQTQMLRSTKTALSIDEELERMRKNLELARDEQTRVLATLEKESAREKRKVFKILSSLGFDAERMTADINIKSPAIGGPFVRLGEGVGYALEGDDERFERINVNLKETAVLRRELAAMPVGIPLRISLRVNSKFGPRRDPFRKVGAMHTGIDYKGQTGDPVYSTAKGKVVRAGWMGGYGRVVEILHARGIITRYAHLNRIDVSIEDSVKKGEIIGRVGSSGRSTGSHLHYEVRVSGKAINPERFMQAGRYVFQKK